MFDGTLILLLNWNGGQVENEETLALRDLAADYVRSKMGGEQKFEHPLILGAMTAGDSARVGGVGGTQFGAKFANRKGQEREVHFLLPYAAENVVVGENATVYWTQFRDTPKGREVIGEGVARDPENRYGRKSGDSLN
jgi:hypothetical protein